MLFDKKTKLDGIRVLSFLPQANISAEGNAASLNFLILEKYIPGREIQVAVMGSKALGGIEIVPTRSFYDYEAKYNSNAKTKHIIPVSLTKQNLQKITAITRKTHQIIGCKGVTRSDFKFFKDKIYLLEINTQPGMTSLSLVPEIANYKGVSFENLVEKILLDASINR